MRKSVCGLFAIAIAGALGCTRPTDAGRIDTPVLGQFADEPALVQYYQETQPILIPDTVARGLPFEVRIPTYAGGCTRSIARTDVEVSGAVINIRPVNRTVIVPGGGCTRDLLVLEHRATIVPTLIGTVVVRIHGAARNSATGSASIPITIDRRVVVR